MATAQEGQVYTCISCQQKFRVFADGTKEILEGGNSPGPFHPYIDGLSACEPTLRGIFQKAILGRLVIQTTTSPA